jgi:hypothetical protein
LIASTGLRLAAVYAGRRPATIPIIEEINKPLKTL